jgi:hypothetical protein
MVLFLMVLICQVLAADDKNTEKTEWYLAKENQDVSLFYRWIKLENGSETREMKAEFTIKAEIPAILSQFSTTENYVEWAVGIKKCGIKKVNDSVWYTHTVMNYPWPLKQKDLVTKHSVFKNQNQAVIEIEAAPEYFSEMIGIERMKNYKGTWNLSYNNDNTTSVDYRVVSFEKPHLPRFVQDPLIQKICLESLVELKELAELQ